MELLERINHYPYKIELIRLLNRLPPDKTRIRQMTIAENVVEIRGVTPKGSELLSAIGAGKWIQNARFTKSVRQDRKTGMEIFSISFVYGDDRKAEAGS